MNSKSEASCIMSAVHQKVNRHIGRLKCMWRSGALRPDRLGQICLVLTSCLIITSCSTSLSRTQWRTTWFQLTDVMPSMSEEMLETVGMMEGLNHMQWYRTFAQRVAESCRDEDDYIVFLTYDSGIVTSSAMVGQSNEWRRLVLGNCSTMRPRAEAKIFDVVATTQDVAAAWTMLEKLRWRRNNSYQHIPSNATCAPTAFLRIAKGNVLRFHCIDGEIPTEYWKLRDVLRGGLSELWDQALNGE